MSRKLFAAAGLTVVIGGIVASIRAQEVANQEPRPFPNEPTLAAPRSAQAAPIVLPSNYQDKGGASTEPAPLPSSSVPTAAERLSQLRELSRDSANKSGRSGASVSGPVLANPAEAKAARSVGDALKNDVQASSASSSRINGGASGGTSVLKRPATGSSPESKSGESSTARRQLRAPTKPTLAPSKTASPERQPTEKLAMSESALPKMLFQSRGPALRIETNGPKSMKTGTESVYSITVHNDGETEANDIFVRAGLPNTAKAVAENSAADAAQTSDSPNEQRFVWTIAKLAPHGVEQLTLRVTPTENKPLDLFVDWTTRPVSALAQIEVLQPQLELSVFGPKDINYGEAATYTLRLTNPGNGDADGVTVEFGYGNERLEPKQVGLIAAGQQLEISLELTARQAGALPVTAVATAAGGLHAEATQDVLVRRAALEVAVTGDATTFSGSPTSYRLVVKNMGNAPAAEITAQIALPEGTKLLQAGDAAQVAQGGLAWNLGNLPPNAERSFDLQCLLTTAGDNAIRVQVSGAGDVTANGSFVTRVEALADLKLTVNDPSGPVAVGQDTVYEIHIVNRGTKAANKINVIAQFSQGIEAVEVTGATAEIVPGQVLFQAIPRIEPGQELTLVVRARADSQGTKRFRAEVASEELDTQLVAQETTYFYVDKTAKK